MHNKHLGRIAARQAESIDVLAPEKYGIQKEKAADTQRGPA